MWSRVEMCVVFCNFKKEACRVEMEPGFFFPPPKKLCPLMEEKGKSIPTHLTCSL